MISASRALLFLIISLTATLSGVSAHDFPADANQQISKILEAPEFQPRRITKGPLEKILAQIGSYVLNKAKRFFRNLSANKFKFSESSWITRFFKWIGNLWSRLMEPLGNFVNYSFLIMVGFAVCFLLYYIYKHLSFIRIFRRRSLQVKTSGESVSSEQGPSIDELFSSRNLLATLTAIRGLLRKELLSDFPAADSLTDRELKRKAAGHARFDVFKLASELFEQTIFAGQALSDQAVAELYRLYSESRLKKEF